MGLVQIFTAVAGNVVAQLYEQEIPPKSLGSAVTHIGESHEVTDCPVANILGP